MAAPREMRTPRALAVGTELNRRIPHSLATLSASLGVVSRRRSVQDRATCRIGRLRWRVGCSMRCWGRGESKRGVDQVDADVADKAQRVYGLQPSGLRLDGLRPMDPGLMHV